MKRGCLRVQAVLALVLGGLVPPVSAFERRPAPSLAVPTDPPVFGYALEAAFGPLRFVDPVVITAPPGETNRLFVVEQDGVVAVIPDLQAPSRQVFLDLTARVSGGRPTDERGLLGLAFHPGYATNGQFFLFYSATTNGVLHQRLARFEVDPSDPDRALPGSERLLISQRDDANNHNGGDLHFGPDGYLYVSLGDEGNQDDSLNNSQRIDKDFFSGLLRLDVDRRPGSLRPNPHPAVFPDAYAVPPDNPWIGATQFAGRALNPANVRTEFWAVGLRNPWRMSFDPDTGRLWVGDVGGSAREEVNIVTRGGNYGWAWREGTLVGPKGGSGAVDYGFLPPLVEYGRTGAFGGRSITGGLVYRGSRWSQLYGAYVFADYVSGNVWAVRYDGRTVGPMERLLGRTSIAGFGRDPRNGDVLLADQGTDIIQRLVYSSQATGQPLPPTLADTGAFEDLDTLRPASGVVPYEINVPFWSDGAAKQRWFSVPETNRFLEFRRDEPWSFPSGTVWVKHFELESTRGDPSTRRRLETRFLVRNASGVHGFTYRWTDPPTNALLVAEEGLDEALTVLDGGVVRTQVWRYPSRGECQQCHTPAAGWALGFNTRQLNRPVDFGDGAVPQIERLALAGYFVEPPDERHTLPALAPSTDGSASVGWRVRSWLDANCSGCHQPGGTALGAWDARARTPLSASGLVLGSLNNDRGDPEARLVVPGSVERSMLHARLRLTGEGRMPPVASRVLDDDSAALLRRWITNDLPRQPSFAEWQTAEFGSTEVPDAALGADPDGDRASNELEYLSGTDPKDPGEAWGVTVERSVEGVRLRFPRPADRGCTIEWTDRPSDPGSWRPWDVPENRFWIAAEPSTVSVVHAPAESARYFRVRLEEY